MGDEKEKEKEKEVKGIKVQKFVDHLEVQKEVRVKKAKESIVHALELREDAQKDLNQAALKVAKLNIAIQKLEGLDFLHYEQFLKELREG